ncbi:hypothetical protein [Archangium sp.]|uniref:hypothetical protein n=1 Tax=Archangium sp. TaxID=1872627 RepID=UPI00286C7FEA|nr:hypothetical protein [Archangium sp.]
MRLALFVCCLSLSALSVVGCATSSEHQRRAQEHQNKSDQAADKGQYGIAEDEQRKAADSHHEAVKKAIDEGAPLPPPTQRHTPSPDAGP